MSSRERRRQPAAAEHSPLRRAVSIPALVHEPKSCPLMVGIVDISTSGCRVSAGFRLAADGAIRLMIPGIVPVRAAVVWTTATEAAVRFELPLHPAVLRHLVATYPPVAVATAPRDQVRVMTATAPAAP